MEISIDYLDIAANRVENEKVEEFENIGSVVDFLILNEMAVEESIISVNIYLKSSNEIRIFWINENDECNTKNRLKVRKKFEKYKVFEKAEKLYNILYEKDISKLLERGGFIEN